MGLIQGRRGLAAIFDAMMFLAVMSSVSVLVLYSLTKEGSLDEAAQDYVLSVHHSLLRCSYGGDGNLTAPMTLGEYCRRDPMSGPEVANVAAFVRVLLINCFDGRPCSWSMTRPGLIINVGVDWHADDVRESYVSTIVSGSGPSKTQFTLTLRG